MGRRDTGPHGPTLKIQAQPKLKTGDSGPKFGCGDKPWWTPYGRLLE
jgi:hypothetical protein